MPSDKPPRPAHDPAQILPTQSFEVERLASRHGLSRPVVVDAIRKHGPMRRAVEAYLETLHPHDRVA